MPSSIQISSPGRTSLRYSAGRTDARSPVPTTGSRVEHERPPRLEVDATTAAGTEGPEADLRTLEVLEDRDGPAPSRLGLPEAADDVGVLGVGTVGEVQPGHVHAGRGQPVELLQARARGADGTDDLGASHVSRSRGRHGEGPGRRNWPV